MAKKTIYISGEKINSLIFIKDVDDLIIPSGAKIRRALFKCECGKEFITHINFAKSKHTISCGCKSSRNALGDSRKKLNGKVTTEYQVWGSMIKRCTNPNALHYIDYGGRGITVCDRWRNSFENFFDDMGKRPKNMSLNRINNDGNYEASNCNWSTKKEQARNKRNNRVILYNGETLCLAEWAERYNIKSPTLARRLGYGWQMEKALTHPLKNKINQELIATTKKSLAAVSEKMREMSRHLAVTA